MSLLGLDIGTTGVKAIAFSREGEVLSHAHCINRVKKHRIMERITRKLDGTEFDFFLNPATKFHRSNNTFNRNNISRLPHVYVVFSGNAQY